MDFEGNPLDVGAADITALTVRVDALEAEVKTIDSEIADLTSQLTFLQGKARRIAESCIYKGTPLLTASITPVDMTPPSNLVGSLTYPFSDCTDGMAFRLKVYGTLTCDVTTSFRLYVAQDPAGNFEYSSIEFMSLGVLAAPTPHVWEFTVIFRQLQLPINTYAITQVSSGEVFYLDNPTLDPINVDGIKFYVIAQFADASSATRNFTLNTLTLERIANFG